MEFKPQMTTHSSYEKVESDLFKSFKAMGYDSKVAEAVAHSFTLYMLDYVTAEGAARAILDSGADEETARELATMFRSVRQEKLPEAVGQ
jgi:hypothetical protein